MLLMMLTAVSVPAPAQFLRGVNLAGAEFGDSRISGVMNRDYTYNSEASFRYLAAKSMSLVRIPVRWERLQPAPSGPLDPENLNALKRNIAWAASYGLKVIIDVHNYGRYKLADGTKLLEYTLDNPLNGSVRVPGSALADLWYRLATEFKSEPAIYAYGLMNEPHDMGQASWKEISQMALGAIRGAGDTRLVMVAGDGWSSAQNWPAINGPSGWINDPLNHFAYEAHIYFDSDNSGTYTRSYDEELAANPDLAAIGRNRLKPFADWCRVNNALGFIGEYGAPGDDPRWLAVLDDFLSALDEAGMDATYWAAGEWWGDYALSVQPRDNFSADRPQMAVLQAHPGRVGLTLVSSATFSTGPAAAGSFATALGSGLAPSTAQATDLPWPTTLGGVQLEMSDSGGQRMTLPLLMTSPGQVNFLIPVEAAPGPAGVLLKSNGRVIAGGTVEITRVAPGLFSANGDGKGVAAAQILRVNAGAEEFGGNVARFEQTEGRFVAEPVAFGDPAEHVILVLLGTGFRNITTATSASLRIGTTPVPVLFAGAYPELPGLDILRAELPHSLAGAGELPVNLTVEGHPANTVSISFR